MTRKEYETGMCRYLLAADKISFMDLEIYEERIEAKPVIAMKDGFAAFGVQADPDNPDDALLFYTSDITTANKTHDAMEKEFATRKKLILGESDQSECPRQLERSVDADEAVFYMPLLHPAMGGEEMYDEWVEEGRIHDLMIQTHRIMLNMYKTAKKKKMILAKSALDRLKKRQTVGAYSFRTRLSKKEILRFMDAMKEQCEKHNISVYVFDDTTGQKPSMPHLVMYSNKEEAFYLKPETNVVKDLHYYFRFDSPELALGMFDHLSNQNVKPFEEEPFEL